MTPALNMSPIRRPNISAKGAARSAPKKVPADRIETIKELSLAVRVLPSEVNSLSQYGMAMMPMLVRVDFVASQLGRQVMSRSSLSNVKVESRNKISQPKIDIGDFLAIQFCLLAKKISSISIPDEM